MVVFYADENMEDIGVLKGFKLDVSISMEAGENTFEVRTSTDGVEMYEGYYIYVEGSEYGGIVDNKRINTKDKTLYYSGRTWRGMLESKIIQPASGQDYYKLSGDLNSVIDQLVDDFDLGDLFYVDSTVTSATVTNYQFYRYTDVYSGIVKLLSDNEYKLIVEFDTDELKCKLSAQPVIDYGENQEITSDLYDFDIQQVGGTVNHLIALGQGELKDRTVIHKYADEYGFISNVQTFFGKDEIVAIYDNSSAETSAELEESAIEYFQKLIGSDNIKITLNNVNADVGDKLTAYEEKTGIEAIQYIQSKVITIDDNTMNVQHSAKTIQISQNGEVKYRGGGGGADISRITEAEIDEMFGAASGTGTDAQDYVIEQGSYAITPPTGFDTAVWYYRKWAGGKVELWHYTHASLSFSSQYGYAYYTKINNYPFPTGLFLVPPMIQATIERATGLCFIKISSADKDKMSFVVCDSNNDGAETTTIHFYVIGSWK